MGIGIGIGVGLAWSCCSAVIAMRRTWIPDIPVERLMGGGKMTPHRQNRRFPIASKTPALCQRFHCRCIDTHVYRMGSIQP